MAKGSQCWLGKTSLIPHERLFDGGEVFQRRQEHVPVLWPADILDKVAQLFAEGGEDFIFVFHRFYAHASALYGESQSHASWRRTIEEWDELIARPLRAQGEGDGGQAPDGIETEENIVVLKGVGILVGCV